MRTSSPLARIILLAITVYVSLGCITTARRSPVAIKPEDLSIGASYSRGYHVDDQTGYHMSLLTIDFRRGMGRGMDWGLIWTYDWTDNNGSRFSTIWADYRWQLTNREATPYKPMVSLGYALGMNYKQSNRDWTVSFPAVVGMKFEKITAMLNARLDYISNTISPIPQAGTAPRTIWGIGWEIPLAPDKNGYGRRFDIEIERVNSLWGGPGMDGVLFNFTANWDLRLK